MFEIVILPGATNTTPPQSGLLSCKATERSFIQKLKNFSAAKEIFCFLLNLQVHCRVHNNPPQIIFCGKLSYSHLIFHLFNIYINIIFSSTSICSTFPYKNQVCRSLPSHSFYIPISFSSTDYPNNSIFWQVQSMEFLIMQFWPTSNHFLPLLCNHSLQCRILNTPRCITANAFTIYHVMYL